MLSNFSFVVDGILAGCAHPATMNLDEALSQIQQKGIGAIVSLDEHGVPVEQLAERGIGYKHIPIPDFHPPTPSQIDEFIEFVNQQSANGKSTVAHCFAGYGRTGTMIACYLVSTGISAKDAVMKVRELRPGSIETREQIEAIIETENRYHKA